MWWAQVLVVCLFVVLNAFAHAHTLNQHKTNKKHKNKNKKTKTRYHLLHPDYIGARLRQLQRSFRLLVLLVLVDVEDAGRPLVELGKMAVGADASLVCAWSSEVC